jgi:hypothetical protein
MADAFPTSDPSPVLPFDRAYWVLPGQLLAGYVPVKPDPAGIRTFVNLMHDDEQNYAGQVIPGYEQALAEEAAALGVVATAHRLPIVDLDVPTEAHMQRVLDVLDAALVASRPAYVHCWGGRGRTGTVVGCFLARHGYASGQRALDFVQHLRRTDAKSDTRSPETPAQCQFVREWPIGQ